MNDPFREYMQKSQLSDKVQEILDETEKRLVIEVLKLAEIPPEVMRIFVKLIENGCPVSAIVKTFSDLGKEEEEEE